LLLFVKALDKIRGFLFLASTGPRPRRTSPKLRLDIGDALSTALGEMLLVPCNAAVDGIDGVAGFADTVAFARIAN